MKKTIGVFVGSLRKASFSGAVARAVMDIGGEGLYLTPVEIGGLPMFNQDYDDEGNAPAEWALFRGTVDGLDGFLFITPEYNRSVPPVLKNAVDIASRPKGQNCWGGKPGAIISVSPGAVGGFGSSQHLRQTLSCLNVHTMNQPEAYLGGIEEVLDASGNLTGQRTVQFLQRYMAAFARWVERHGVE